LNENRQSLAARKKNDAKKVKNEQGINKKREVENIDLETE